MLPWSGSSSPGSWWWWWCIWMWSLFGWSGVWPWPWPRPWSWMRWWSWFRLWPWSWSRPWSAPSFFSFYFSFLFSNFLCSLFCFEKFIQTKFFPPFTENIMIQSLSFVFINNLLKISTFNFNFVNFLPLRENSMIMAHAFLLLKKEKKKRCKPLSCTCKQSQMDLSVLYVKDLFCRFLRFLISI